MEKRYYYTKEETWCDKCHQFIFYKPPAASAHTSDYVDTGGFNDIMALASILDGNFSDAVLHNEIGNLKRQMIVQKAPPSCPTCGNTNLKRKTWRGYTNPKSKLQPNPIRVEEYDSKTKAGKIIHEGFDLALTFSDKTTDELVEMLKIISEGKQKGQSGIPDKVFKHRIYRRGFIGGLVSLIEHKTPKPKLGKKLKLRI